MQHSSKAITPFVSSPEAERVKTVLTNELVDDSVLDVSSVVPVQQHLALHVKEVDGTARHRAPFPGSESTDTSVYWRTTFVSSLDFP